MTTVLITGGSGGIASRVRPHLRDSGWSIRLFDERPPTEPPSGAESFIEGSILDDDALAAASAGADAVVHLAAYAAERPWADILALNVDGTERMLRAARDAGIRRVLNAGTNHAVGFTAWGDTAAAEVLVPRPDSYYGVTKAAAEALCNVFADRYGMTIVTARILNATTMRDDARQRITWFDPTDIARLIAATVALDAPGHHIVWGASRGAEPWFPLEPGRRIGFDPQVDLTEPGDAEAAAADPDPLGHDFTTHPLGEHW